ncbi:MAG: translation initiation factor IF-2 N-terminal domain-containing protein, partial [Bdellovibrionales bacterium]|nr:translation initiation factor IF-2 N-terminal domain-containing protein [Oligoflexia bacterium]
MTDREPLKVYELAKELGIDSISLVDKLKTLEINVKNHMSELTDSDADRARSVLKTGSVSGRSAAGATAAKAPKTATGAPKKVVARRAGSNETAPVAKSAAPGTASDAPAKTVKKRAPTQAVAPAPTPASAAAAETSSSSTVIRRRVLSDGATQIVTSTVSTVTGTDSNPQAVEARGNEDAAPMEAKAPAPAEEAAPRAPMLTTSAVQAATPFSPVAQAPVAPTPVVAAPKVAAPAEPKLTAAPAAVQEAPPTPNANGIVETVRTEVKSEGGKITTSVIRRTETTLTTSSMKDGSKRVGGLRIIEQPKVVPVKAGFTKTPGAGEKKAPGAATDDKTKGGFKTERDGFKFARVDKENLDKMAEEEARKRGPKAFDTVIKPEDVKFGDYRKKEMIFIPKRKRAPVGKNINRTEITVAAQHKRVVEMGDTIKIADLAAQMGAKGSDVIKKLMGMGQMATLNQVVDFDTASLVAHEFQHEVKNIAFKENEVLESSADTAEELVFRPP